MSSVDALKWKSFGSPSKGTAIVINSPGTDCSPLNPISSNRGVSLISASPSPARYRSSNFNTGISIRYSSTEKRHQVFDWHRENALLRPLPHLVGDRSCVRPQYLGETSGSEQRTIRHFEIHVFPICAVIGRLLCLSYPPSSRAISFMPHDGRMQWNVGRKGCVLSARRDVHFLHSIAGMTRNA